MKTRLDKWRARVRAAEKRGHFTRRDDDDSGNWDRCAVGEGLGKPTGRPPQSSGLVALGGLFDYHVNLGTQSEYGWGPEAMAGHVKSAGLILGKIEDRLRVLKEQGWKPPEAKEE